MDIIDKTGAHAPWPDMTPLQRQPPGILYHYCSNASFLSIVSTRAIWASEFSLSNDRLEGRWIRTVIEESCKDQGLDASQIAIVLKEFDAQASLYGAAGVCLSEDGDQLSQWRAYSTDGAGVSIGFDSSSFTPPNMPAVFPIVYEPVTQKQIIAPTIRTICDLFASGVDLQDYNAITIDDHVLETNKNSTLNGAMRSLVLQLKYAFKNCVSRRKRVAIRTPRSNGIASA